MGAGVLAGHATASRRTATLWNGLLTTAFRVGRRDAAVGNTRFPMSILRRPGSRRLRRASATARRLYDIDISSMNLRHHWNASSRTSAADVSDLPSVIHSSQACAV